MLLTYRGVFQLVLVLALLGAAVAAFVRIIQETGFVVGPML